MKTIRCLSLLAAFGCFANGAAAGAFPQAYTYVDVSFKIMVKSTGETLMSPSDVAAANAAADAMLWSESLNINQMMDYSWRGLRYRRFGDVEFVRADVSGLSADFKTKVDSVFRTTYATAAAYDAADPFGKVSTYGQADKTGWRWYDDRANFYLINGFSGGVGTGSANLMVQGGFWVNPGTHEFGHWFTLPHPFRTSGGVKDASGKWICYWSDEEPNPEGGGAVIHGDGFTDTLFDYPNACNLTLNDIAKRDFTADQDSANLLAYDNLTSSQKTTVQNTLRNHYADQFFNKSYSQLTIAEQGRLPNGLPVTPDNSHRETFARHIYGQLYAGLTIAEQGLINGLISGATRQTQEDLAHNIIDDDLVAHHNLGLFYDQTNAAQKESIRVLNANIMAYRAGKGSPYGIFSKQQLDRMADVISGTDAAGQTRADIRGLEFGVYRFFGGAVTNSAAISGSSANPHGTPALAAAADLPAANPGIFIGRPGAFSGNLTITKPTTIRATRDGPVTIGAAAHPNF